MAEKQHVPDASAIGEPRRQPLAVIVFAALAVLIVWAAGKILAAYITPIILALVIVTFTFPTFERVTGRLNGRSSLAAGIMLLVVTFTVILPLAVVSYLLVQQAIALAQLLQDTDMPAMLQAIRTSDRLLWIKRLFPSFDPASIQPERWLATVVKLIPGWVAAHGTAVFSGFAQVIIGFFMMLLAMYYFYVDGRRLTQELVFLSPLPDEYDKEIFDRFRGTIDATFRGQILTAVAQGALTGTGLAIAGVPAPVFWGAIAALFALIPMVGAAMVWVPAAAYLFFIGSTGWGIFMVLWGALAVSLVDNLIRPWAMKSGLNLPAIVLIFAILGGMQAFGFVGLVLGPLVFALLATVLSMYKSFFARSLAMQNKEAGGEALR